MKLTKEIKDAIEIFENTMIDQFDDMVLVSVQDWDDFKHKVFGTKKEL